MLGKMVWNLIHSANKLWVRLLMGVYCTGSDFFSTQGRHGSALWKALLKTRALIFEGFAWRVGEGNLPFWFANWTGFGPLCSLVPYVHISDTALLVRDVFLDGV